MNTKRNENDDVAFKSESQEVYSDHTVGMREALVHCQELLSSARSVEIKDIGDLAVAEQARSYARSLPTRRQETLAAMRTTNTSLSSSTSQDITFPVLQQMISPADFRRDFLYANRPCKITDSRWCQFHFSKLLDAWTTTASVVNDGEGDDTEIVNRSWFETRLGRTIETPALFLPVRCQPQNGNNLYRNSIVDDDGRAVECETRNMPLSEWLAILNDDDDDSDNSSPPPTDKRSYYYLKDWHLQLWLSDRSESPLYVVPEHFETDLLNRFLLRFTCGDYRFTYWGPTGSCTGLHADVLNSFSWSLNVMGTKEWTFFVPPLSSSCEERSERPGRDEQMRNDRTEVVVTIQQQAGECIFVPSGWQHTVVNIGETLSVNHNWITTANVDLTWQCMLSEMLAVDEELAAWSSDNATDWDAKESMIRGCIGLDVTSFLLMVLMGLLDLLQNGDANWEYYFSMTRLSDTLRHLVADEQLHLLERLQASLADELLGSVAFDIVQQTLKLVNDGMRLKNMCPR
jgi:hypothetical protein